MVLRITLFLFDTYSAYVTLSGHVRGYPYPCFHINSMVPGIYSTIMFTFDHQQQRTQTQHTHATHRQNPMSSESAPGCLPSLPEQPSALKNIISVRGPYHPRTIK